MPAASLSLPAQFPVLSAVNRTPSTSSRSKDLGLLGTSPCPGKLPARRKQVAPPSSSADRAQHRLNTMTRAEHERVTAFLKLGSFKAAALYLDIHEKTVAKTWQRYSADIAIVIADLKRDANNSPVH